MWDTQIRYFLKNVPHKFFFSECELQLSFRRTSEDVPLLLCFRHFLAGMHSGTGGTCSNFTAELWVCVLICVGSAAIRRAELLCSFTGCPSAPCDSSVLTLPPPLSHRHTFVYVHLLPSPPWSKTYFCTMQAKRLQFHHTIFLCSCCSNALQFQYFYWLIN